MSNLTAIAPAQMQKENFNCGEFAIVKIKAGLNSYQMKVLVGDGVVKGLCDE